MLEDTLTKTSQARDLLWQLTQNNQGPVAAAVCLLLRREILLKAIDLYLDPIKTTGDGFTIRDRKVRRNYLQLSTHKVF